MSHIMVWRGELPEDGVTGFWHHGILCSDNTVIHYSGMDGMKTLHNAQILRTGMDRFNTHAERRVHKVSYPDARPQYPHSEIVQRAESRLGQRGYHLLFRNCESFARWCVLGEENSCQVQGALFGVVGGFASLVLGGGVLGAALTALVAQRAWDNGRNRSDWRRQLNGRQDGGDSNEEHHAAASSGMQIHMDEIDSD